MKKSLIVVCFLAVFTVVALVATDAFAVKGEEEVTGIINRFLNGVILPFFESIVDIISDAIIKVVKAVTPSFLQGDE